MMKLQGTPVTICWWIIGRDNSSQDKALGFDLHDADGKLVCETHGFDLDCTRYNVAKTRGELFIQGVAMALGIKDIVYDTDTESSLSKD